MQAYGLYSLAIQTIANGEGDLAKHMFKYVQIQDVLFVLLLLVLLLQIDKSRRKLTQTLIPALGVLVLLLPFGTVFAQNIQQSLRSAPPSVKATVGDVAILGHWDGEPIRWLIVAENRGTLTLMALNDVARLPFEATNNNFWPEADLRDWLNTYFLENAFGESPHVHIQESSRYLILSAHTRHYAEIGDRDFYAFHIPRYAFRGIDRAYRMEVTDQVRLPCAEIMQTLYNMGAPIRGSYWMETPHFNNAQMLRYVTRDGFISLRDARDPAGVRPVIEISR